MKATTAGARRQTAFSETISCQISAGSLSVIAGRRRERYCRFCEHQVSGRLIGRWTARCAPSGFRQLQLRTRPVGAPKKRFFSDLCDILFIREDSFPPVPFDHKTKKQDAIAGRPWAVRVPARFAVGAVACSIRRLTGAFPHPGLPWTERPGWAVIRPGDPGGTVSDNRPITPAMPYFARLGRDRRVDPLHGNAYADRRDAPGRNPGGRSPW